MAKVNKPSLDTLGDIFRFAVRRFKAARLAYGHGTTNARGLAVGALLTLEHYPRADQNREYLIVSASYELSFDNYESLPQAGGTSYRCGFAAMPSSQQFRPRRQTLPGLLCAFSAILAPIVCAQSPAARARCCSRRWIWTVLLCGDLPTG